MKVRGWEEWLGREGERGCGPGLARAPASLRNAGERRDLCVGPRTVVDTTGRAGTSTNTPAGRGETSYASDSCGSMHFPKVKCLSVLATHPNFALTSTTRVRCQHSHSADAQPRHPAPRHQPGGLRGPAASTVGRGIPVSLKVKRHTPRGQLAPTS